MLARSLLPTAMGQEPFVTHCNGSWDGNAAMQNGNRQPMIAYISGVKWHTWANDMADAPSIGWKSPAPDVT
jgi:hypothetical protein